MAGRKTKYNPKFPDVARELAALGARSTRQLAKRLGALAKKDISPATIHAWRREYPEFDAAIHAGNQTFLRDAALPSLVRLTKGYTYTEKTYQQAFPNKDGVEILPEPVLYRAVRKHMAPNPGAVGLALAIADERLNPKKKIDHSGEVVNRHGMTEEAAAVLEGLYGGKPEACNV